MLTFIIIYGQIILTLLVKGLALKIKFIDIFGLYGIEIYFYGIKI